MAIAFSTMFQDEALVVRSLLQSAGIEVELAGELQAALCQIPMAANSVFFRDLVLRPMQALSAERPQAAAQAEERGQRLRLDGVIASLLDLLVEEKNSH